METDPKKLEALKHSTPPTNASDLKTFLGMTNYSSCFIRNYSKKTEILRELLKENVKWEWSDRHQNCFDELKEALQSDNVLGCFKVNAITKVIVDASPTGLGAMLLQEQTYESF